MKEKVLNILKHMQKIYSDNQLGIFAGNATLFIITAVFPLLMLVISVVGMLPGYTPDDVTDLLFQFLPDLQPRTVALDGFVGDPDLRPLQAEDLARPHRAADAQQKADLQ